MTRVLLLVRIVDRNEAKLTQARFSHKKKTLSMVTFCCTILGHCLRVANVLLIAVTEKRWRENVEQWAKVSSFSTALSFVTFV
jgi:hypothetical protein